MLTRRVAPDELATPSPSKSRAPAWHRHDTDVTDFGPSRLDDDVDVVACEDCGKPVLRDALSFHHGKPQW
jgi:SAGA-associated factor 73